MIECESCEGWFHGQCVGVLESESDTLVDWRCPTCRPLPHCEVPPTARIEVETPAAAASGAAAMGGYGYAPVETCGAAPESADLSLLLNFAGGGGA